VGIVGWVGGRIFLLPYCCIYASIYNFLYVMPLSLNPFEQDTLQLCYAFMTALLAVLQLLQLYWTYFILSFLIKDRNTPKLPAKQ
jgi:hypothetical protein